MTNHGVRLLPSVVSIPQFRGDPKVRAVAYAFLDGPANSSTYLLLVPVVSSAVDMSIANLHRAEAKECLRRS